MPSDPGLILPLGLVGAGILTILLIGLVCLRKNEVTWGAVGALLIGAFLVAAPLITHLRFDQQGFSVETVARAAVGAADTSIKNSAVIAGLQKALEDMKKQVESLAAQQEKIVAAVNQRPAAAGAPPISPTDTQNILSKQMELQNTLKSNEQLIQQLRPNDLSRRAVDDLKRALKL